MKRVLLLITHCSTRHYINNKLNFQVLVFCLLFKSCHSLCIEDAKTLTCHNTVQFRKPFPNIKTLILFDSLISEWEIRRFFPRLETIYPYGFYKHDVCSFVNSVSVENCFHDASSREIILITTSRASLNYDDSDVDDDDDNSGENSSEQTTSETILEFSLAALGFVATSAFAYYKRKFLIRLIIHPQMLRH